MTLYNFLIICYILLINNSKDKLIEQFLDNPTKLKYEKIESIMLNVGFSIEWAKGSHKKISYQNLKLHLSIPLHK